TGVERPLEPFVERAVIRIIGEGLRNVGQHSGASNAKVILRYDDEQVVATIEADGKGFESNELNTAAQPTHSGIVGICALAAGWGQYSRPSPRSRSSARPATDTRRSPWRRSFCPT